MRTRSELKATALAKCRVNWTPLVLSVLVYIAVTAATAVTTFAAGLVQIFLLAPIEVALINCFLAYDRDQTNTGLIEGMFKRAFDKNYLHKVLGMFLVTLFVALWSLLLIIPGLIKAYAYAMTPFILEENPDMPAYDAIKYSEKIMMGHKWDFFILNLSFIGWAILCCFTFGIGYLWLIPYIQLAQCEFYEDLKADQAGKPLEGTVN
jgi:uncharacterized membrane protein